MALTERLEIFIGIHNDGQLEFRRTRVFIEDEIIIANNHHRQILEPGQDISLFPSKIRQIANLIWTPQVVADFLAEKEKRLKSSGVNLNG